MSRPVRWSVLAHAVRARVLDADPLGVDLVVVSWYAVISVLRAARSDLLARRPRCSRTTALTQLDTESDTTGSKALTWRHAR